MIDLLDKLDKLEIKPTDKISENDKIFLDKLRFGYNNIVTQLFNVRETLREQENLNEKFEELYEVSDYGSISLKRRYDDDEKIWGADYSYTFKYPLKHVQNLIETSKNKVVRDIVSYFNKTYTLNIGSDDYFEFKNLTSKKKKKALEVEVKEEEVANIDEIVDWVLTQTGGLTLNEMGVKLLKDSFTKDINGRSSGWGDNKKDLSAILKANSLTIPDYLYYYQGNKYSYSSSDNRRYNDLITALIHFDNGSTKLDYSLVSLRIPSTHYGDNSHFDFSAPYETILDKVESLRFYGNGKVIIKFKSSSLASEFVSYYSIQLADSKVKI